MPRLFVLSERFTGEARWDDATPEMHQLRDASRMQGVDVEIAGLDNVTVVAPRGREPRMWIGTHEPGTRDGLVVRGTRQWASMADLCTRLVLAKGAYSLDTRDRFDGGTASKTFTTISRSKGRLGSDSVVIAQRQTLPTDELLDSWMEAAGLTFPVVVKPSSGSQGVGVTEVNGYEDLRRALANLAFDDHIIQRRETFIAEYRVLVLHGRSLGSARKDAPAASLTANAATGAEFVLDGAPDVVACAIKAAPGHGFVGIDIGVTAGGELRVIEINYAPQWVHFARAVGCGVADIVVADFVDHLRRGAARAD